MTRTAIATLSALFVLACAPSLALAKGPSQATITGPGLDSSITVGPEVTMELADASGFFRAVFSYQPTSMPDERPEGDLGPRYVIEYLLYTPNSRTDRIVQDLYPYATQPVTYVEPGQPQSFTAQTRGGWFVGSAELTRVLLEAGLPESPPAGGGDESLPWRVVAALGALGLLVVAALGVRLRRRSQPAPAS